MMYKVVPSPLTSQVRTLPRSRRAPYRKRMGFLSGRPAFRHRDALRCANGPIHMLIYGQPREEIAVFSEETLYPPRWESAPEPPHIAHALPEVRRMLRAGDYQSVPNYVIEQVTKDPVYDTLMPLSPDGRTRYSIKRWEKHAAYIMKLTGLAEEASSIVDYLRSMDLETGEALIRFRETNADSSESDSSGIIHTAATSDSGTSHTAAVSDSGTSHTAAMSDSGTSHTAAVSDSGTSHTAAMSDSGTSHTTSVSDSGTSHTTSVSDSGLHLRRSFVSRADGAAIQDYQFPEPREALTLSLAHEQLAGLHVWDGLGFVSDLTQTLSWDGELVWFTARYAKDCGHPDAGFISAVRIVTDGRVEFVCDDTNGTAAAQTADGTTSGSALTSRLIIRGAAHLMLLADLRRFEPLTDELIDEIRRKLLALPTDYERLLARQNAVHGELMRRTQICLAETEELSLTVEELFENQHCGPGLSKALMEMLYHMGRYYFITDTGTLPPAMGQYNINVNLEVCAGNMTALPEMMQVFFRFFESCFDDFRVNAKNIWGFRGIMGSIHPDLETGYQYHFSGPWPHEYWISCAGWVFREFWDYYLTTADEDFLRGHVYPGLKEIALFYEDYLTDTDEDGSLMFYPGFSPENGQTGGYPITINSVMDISVCVEVLEHLLRACEILGLTETEADNIAKWKSILDRIPPLLLDEEGGLKEWARADIPENYSHRHVSHHYPVWPATQINWEKSPELAKAVLISNRTRGQENDSAHGIMHRLFTAIRLKDSEGALGYFKQMLERGFFNASLMGNHFPHKAYRPEALGGMPAAVTESLVYSEEGRIEFLPLKIADLNKGTLTGTRLFTYAILDELVWDDDAGRLRARITPLKSQKVLLSVRRTVTEARVNGTPAICKDSRMMLSLEKGETLELEFFYR
ncbi:MAG: glycoside hydrolase N-terminal domain-containing protein [Lachnospiraceae bacterium]|nr:glycoside hydrolase N-terminal domain-containing protein [Lachnospiraceae bacterium]